MRFRLRLRRVRCLRKCQLLRHPRARACGSDWRLPPSSLPQRRGISSAVARRRQSQRQLPSLRNPTHRRLQRRCLLRCQHSRRLRKSLRPRHLRLPRPQSRPRRPLPARRRRWLPRLRQHYPLHLQGPARRPTQRRRSVRAKRVKNLTATRVSAPPPSSSERSIRIASEVKRKLPCASVPKQSGSARQCFHPPRPRLRRHHRPKRDSHKPCVRLALAAATLSASSCAAHASAASKPTSPTRRA